MDEDILYFFGEHMDALPIYEHLEKGIKGGTVLTFLPRSP